jgi:hypothetical protein
LNLKVPIPQSRAPCPVSRSFGLYKVEAKELAQIPARVVLESIDAQILIEQRERLFA